MEDLRELGDLIGKFKRKLLKASANFNDYGSGSVDQIATKMAADMSADRAMASLQEPDFARDSLCCIGSGFRTDLGDTRKSGRQLLMILLHLGMIFTVSILLEILKRKL